VWLEGLFLEGIFDWQLVNRRRIFGDRDLDLFELAAAEEVISSSCVSLNLGFLL
jgi:hypothetical protein